MKVLFDARWIYKKPSGIGVYAREMMIRLPRLLAADQFVFLFNDEALRDRLMAGVAECRNVDAWMVPYGPLSLRNQFSMPRELKRIGADLFHTPNYMIPFAAFSSKGRCGTKCLVNIHDVIPLVVADYAPHSRTSRYKGIFRQCLKNSVIRADAVITGSEASRRDMVASLRLKPKQADKIRVIYDGPGGQFDVQEHAPFETDKTTPRTLLYVGRMDPYKNVTGLVEALALAKKRLDFPLQLIVCGPVDDRYPDARELAVKLGVADDVRFTGFVSDDELGEFYRTADLLTHSSRYEGFGLQLVEAMRSGLPVCCTDGGSQPEIVGDAGMIVKAGDALAMADAIAAVLSAPAKMEAMKVAGLARAARFDWAVCAQETAALYREQVPKVINQGVRKK